MLLLIRKGAYKMTNKQLIKCIKKNQTEYFDSTPDFEQKEHLYKKMHNIYNKSRHLARCHPGSKNSIKTFSNLSTNIFECIQFQHHDRLPEYHFDTELLLLNQAMITAIQKSLNTKFDHKCPSYGESLLNCYLDLYITFTINHLDKEIDSHPGFLINPLTGSNMELDVNFEDFKLAFEFQGEHHYTDSNVHTKDITKENILSARNRVLIPINISQLNDHELSTVIINAIKEQMHLIDFVNNNDPSPITKRTAKMYFMLVQRMYLAHVLFEETLNWLDEEAKKYILSRIPSSPISAITKAPRYLHTDDTLDLSVEEIYKRIPSLNRLL